jgi:hypothetical protein
LWLYKRVAGSIPVGHPLLNLSRLQVKRRGEGLSAKSKLL